MQLSETEMNVLNALPLEDVMLHNGYTPSVKTTRHFFYKCPFHAENNPSFQVDRYPQYAKGGGGVSNAYAGFYCYACGESHGSKGYGAMMLQAKLMGVELKEKYGEVAARLAKDFNLVIGGDFKNGFFHRSKQVAPRDEIELNLREDGFTNSELKSLGCRVDCAYKPAGRKAADGEPMQEGLTGADGKPIYKYSFGKGYYSSTPIKESNFNSRLLTERFNLYPVSSYISEKRVSEKSGEAVSYEVTATDAYPIFAFRYQDEKGWWARKYEPNFKTVKQADGKEGASYKFTWWFEGGKPREDMRNMLYGDIDVMNCLNGGEVDTSDEEHPLIEVEVRRNNRRTSVKKFKRLVICSGPRDAINVYFHSDAHVCFPHSESVEISGKTIARLREIAHEVFILYDSDETGIRCANRLALRFLELKVIYLPKDLGRMKSSRTGRPCKDAEEYFNYYPAKLKELRNFHGYSINDHFETLLSSAQNMMFWTRKGRTSKDEYGDTYKVYKYTLGVGNMAQFLSAQGLFRYRDSCNMWKFVYVENNIVEIIEDKEILNKAKQLMKGYLNLHPYYYDKDLMDAISSSRNLTKETLSEVKEIQLNFRSWGKDFDYFFFENCAVRITADEITTESYKDLKFHVNRDAIMPGEFHLQSIPPFRIVHNPEVEKARERFKQEVAGMTAEQRKSETANFRNYERIWAYKLIPAKPVEEMPDWFRFLYDTGRIYWRKEADGYALSAEEQQFQDMHFINKACSLGYILSRYRTRTKQLMGTITDYSVLDEGKASGRNGKSTISELLFAVRKGIRVNGKSFKTSAENFGKNFNTFRLSVDSFVRIDDLRVDVTSEIFYNAVTAIPVKTLYNNEIMVDEEDSPKMLITCNKPFDMSAPSTFGRIYPMLVSDYYHEEAYSGSSDKYSPEEKFGYDLLKESSEENYQFLLNMLARFLQFYLKEQTVIRPPLEKLGIMRQLYLNVKDEMMIEWANGFFSNAYHFLRPISVKEMVISFLDFKGIMVSKESIAVAMLDFKRDLRTYCENMHITINPDIVYGKSKSDRMEGTVRRNAWVTSFLDNMPVEPRVRKLEQDRCYYFYHWGQEPRMPHEVLPATEQDPMLLDAPVSAEEEEEDASSSKPGKKQKD